MRPSGDAKSKPRRSGKLSDPHTVCARAFCRWMLRETKQSSPKRKVSLPRHQLDALLFAAEKFGQSSLRFLRPCSENAFFASPQTQAETRVAGPTAQIPSRPQPPPSGRPKAVDLHCGNRYISRGRRRDIPTSPPVLESARGGARKTARLQPGLQWSPNDSLSAGSTRPVGCLSPHNSRAGDTVRNGASRKNAVKGDHVPHRARREFTKVSSQDHLFFAR